MNLEKYNECIKYADYFIGLCEDNDKEFLYSIEYMKFLSYYRSERYNKALEASEKLINNRPNENKTYYIKYDVLLKLNEEEARQYLEEINRIFPDK